MALANDTTEEKAEARKRLKRWRDKNRDRHNSYHRQYHKTYYAKNKDAIKKRNEERPCAENKPDIYACKKCGVAKPFTEEFFLRSPPNKFKLNYTCRTCTNEYSSINIVKYKYGLTADQAKAMRTAGCVICGNKENIHIDHCHVTGKVRGGLCRGCNHGLGKFKDNPNLLRAAADYLERQ